MAQHDNNKNGGNSSSQLGFEAEMFNAADKLRSDMEPSDYKHVALGFARVENSSAINGADIRILCIVYRERFKVSGAIEALLQTVKSTTPAPRKFIA